MLKIFAALHVALSPNECVMASLDLQNTLKLNILALRHEEKIDSGSFRSICYGIR